MDSGAKRRRGPGFWTVGLILAFGGPAVGFGIPLVAKMLEQRSADETAALIARARISQAGSVATTTAPRLALISGRGGPSESDQFIEIHGVVENIGTTTIDDVMAVVQFYTKDSEFIGSDRALIEYDQLLPGQQAPFKVTARRNPLMDKFDIEFKTIGGRHLPHEDRRKRPR